MTLVEHLVELAMDIESEDPIDFGMLQISERSAFELMANGVLDYYLSNGKDERDMILLATTIKLTVENLVLNLKLLNKERQSR